LGGDNVNNFESGRTYRVVNTDNKFYGETFIYENIDPDMDSCNFGLFIGCDGILESIAYDQMRLIEDNKVVVDGIPCYVNLEQLAIINEVKKNPVLPVFHGDPRR